MLFVYYVKSKAQEDVFSLQTFRRSLCSTRSNRENIKCEGLNRLKCPLNVQTDKEDVVPIEVRHRAAEQGRDWTLNIKFFILNSSLPGWESHLHWPVCFVPRLFYNEALHNNKHQITLLFVFSLVILLLSVSNIKKRNFISVILANIQERIVFNLPVYSLNICSQLSDDV